MSDLDIALISKTNRASLGRISLVAAAIQQQLDGEFFDAWKKHGSINPFSERQPPPGDYAVIQIVNALDDPRLGGFHTTCSGVPFARVAFAENSEWTIDASHEALEMVLDPKGEAFIPGISPLADQGRVQFLLEVCDPCGRKGYLIDDVKVADFHLPQYFDDFESPGTFYSHNENLVRPRQILDGGYLTWRDGNGQFWQQNRFAGLSDPEKIDPPQIGGSIRERVDFLTARAREKHLKMRRKPIREQTGSSFLPDREIRSRRARAVEIKTRIQSLKRALRDLDNS